MTATVAAPAATAGRPRSAPSVLSRAWEAGRGPLMEVGVAFGGAAWMLATTLTIGDFAPLDRNSQVSGLAALQVRFLVPALIGVALLVATRKTPARRIWTSRYAFAVLPGLMSGFVGGGVLLALKGVSLPMNGTVGDAGDMERWAMDLQHGKAVNPAYPPLFPRFVWLVAKFEHNNVFLGLKFAEIITAAILGPAVYLAWRLIAGRAWACTIAVLYTGALSEPYKSYEPVVLGILIPIAIALIAYLRTVGAKSYKQLAIVGLLVGLGIGLIFITFSGPFYWAALGFAVSALAVFPWKAWRNALVLLGTMGVGFLAVGWHLVQGLLNAAPDPYFFFQTDQDPGYPFLYITDMPGPLSKGVWPPIPEAGGVDVFAALMVVALGVALWLGYRKLPILVTASVLAGSWLMRFYLASEMYHDKLVRYWPRTTSVVIYCFLILTVFGVKAAAEKIQERYEALVAVRGGATESTDTVTQSETDSDADARTTGLGTDGDDDAADRPLAARSRGRAAVPSRTAATGATSATTTSVGAGLVAAAFALTFFAGMAGSAGADKIMPKQDGSPGQLSWNAHFDNPHNLRLGVTLVNGK